MHSREKISLVLRSRLPRRPRKTKGPDPNFVIGLLHVSVDLPSKYLNFVRCTFYNSCRIHGSREVAWERERILQTKQKLTSPSPNHSSTICFSSFSELYGILFQNWIIFALCIERIIHILLFLLRIEYACLRSYVQSSTFVDLKNRIHRIATKWQTRYTKTVSMMEVNDRIFSSFR